MKISELTDHDRREVMAFWRFMREVGNAPMAIAMRDHPGWLAYCLGSEALVPWGGAPTRRLLAPPEGCGHLPITAWTMPG